jgi:hypothetical protein
MSKLYQRLKQRKEHHQESDDDDDDDIEVLHGFPWKAALAWWRLPSSCLSLLLQEEEEEEEEEEEQQQQHAERQPHYNVDGLHEKLEDIGWASDAKWEDTLVITNEQDTQVDNVDDDLARELAFYNQVMIDAGRLCLQHSANLLRPPESLAGTFFSSGGNP